MARAAGITIERTMTGNPVSITFSLKKWGEILQNFFLEKGIDVPEDILEPNSTTVKAINTAEMDIVATLKSEDDIINYLYNR